MFKKYKRDIILISILLVIGLLGCLVYFNFNSSSNNLIANITDSNNVVTKIDLEKESETEREITVDGLHEDLKVGVKHNAIRVIYSSCPHQDCVKIGTVSISNKPIVCLYNKVYIVLISNSDGNDINI